MHVNTTRVLHITYSYTMRVCVHIYIYKYNTAGLQDKRTAISRYIISIYISIYTRKTARAYISV